MTEREIIQPTKGGKRYAPRDDHGQFTCDQIDGGKSHAADQRQHSRTPGESGKGDRGDRWS